MKKHMSRLQHFLWAMLLVQGVILGQTDAESATPKTLDSADFQSLPPRVHGQMYPHVNIEPIRLAMPPFSTDRPNVSVTSYTLLPGWMQVESGYTFAQSSWTSFDRTSAHTSETLLRFGVNHHFEVLANVRLNTTYISPTSMSLPYWQTGVLPLSVGFKYNIVKETPHTWRPQITWHSTVTFPAAALGDHLIPAQASFILHEQRLALDKNLTSWWSISSNLGLSGGLVGQYGFVDSGLLSAVTTFSVGKASVYAEYVQNFQLFGTQLATQPQWDLGVTFLKNRALQYDVYGGMYPRDPAVASGANLFVGGGVSYRFKAAQMR